MNVLKLELGDSPRLVSADYGVTIEGLEESLQQLNALIVPAPLILEIDSATYFSLSPVLRCRWKGKACEGKWTVRFAMSGVEGLSSNFSQIVSVSRRPSASDDWELVNSVDGTEQDLLGTEQDSGGTETVEAVWATVTHFSDLVSVVSKRTAEQESDGYIIQSRFGRSPISVRPVDVSSQQQRRRLNEMYNKLVARGRVGSMLYRNLSKFTRAPCPLPVRLVHCSRDIQPQATRVRPSYPLLQCVLERVQKGALAQRVQGEAGLSPVLAFVRGHSTRWGFRAKHPGVGRGCVSWEGSHSVQPRRLRDQRLRGLVA